MRARHALGPACGAGGVLEHGVVVRRRGAGGCRALAVKVHEHLDRPRHARCDRRAELGRTGVGDDHSHVAFAEVELELGLLEGRVERHRDGAGAQNGKEGDREGRFVRQHERHGVTGGDAARGQRARQPLHAVVQLAVGDPLVAVDERHPIPEGGCARVEHLGDRRD